MSTQRHPTRREQYDDLQSSIVIMRDVYRTTPAGHPEKADRERLLRIDYREIIDIAPAADKTYWREQRDTEFPESAGRDDQADR